MRAAGQFVGLSLTATGGACLAAGIGITVTGATRKTYNLGDGLVQCLQVTGGILLSLLGGSLLVNGLILTPKDATTT